MKKKMIKEGLLDEKGKANERTPSDWYSKYKELTHYGQRDSPNGATATPAAGQATSSTVSPVEQQPEQVAGEKKKKKKKRKDSGADSE